MYCIHCYVHGHKNDRILFTVGFVNIMDELNSVWHKFSKRFGCCKKICLAMLFVSFIHGNSFIVINYGWETAFRCETEKKIIMIV